MTDAERVQRLDETMLAKSGGRWGLRQEAFDDAVWLVMTDFGWDRERAEKALRESATATVGTSATVAEATCGSQGGGVGCGGYYGDEGQKGY